MLGNIVRVRHVPELLRYVLNKPGAEVLTADSVSGDPERFAKVITHLAEHHPRLEKPVAHADIDLRPGLRLSDDQWREVAAKVRARMGYADSPFLLVRHSDAPRDHVHALMGTVRYDGSVVNDTYEIKRFHAAVGEVAQKLGMRVERARDRSAGHRAQYRADLRGDPLKQAVAEAYKAPSFEAWQAQLKAQGIEPSYHLRRDGHLQGIAFRIESRWVKARVLGKQYAAGQLRKQYELTPGHLELMVRQNQLVGRGRTELTVKPRDASQAAADSVLVIEPEGTQVRPSLGVRDPGPAPRTPPRSRRMATLLNALEKPTMPLRLEEYVGRHRPAPSTWLEDVLAQRIHPERCGDAHYQAATRFVAARLLDAPDRHPRLVARVAQQAPPHPRLRSLLERSHRPYAPERHLPHLAADPESYASRYSRVLRLHSEWTEARIHQAAEVPEVWDLEREIRATLLPRRHAHLPEVDLHAWRHELMAGRRSDAGEYLVCYKHRLEDQLARAAPVLRREVAGLEQRAASLPAESLERYALLGRAASLDSYLLLHPPPGPQVRPRRPGRSRLDDALRYLSHPRRAAQLDLAQKGYRRLKVNQAVRAYRRMRSPLRGIVREIANLSGRPYLAALVLVPPTVLQRQLRQALERTVLKDYLDHSVDQKMLLQILRGRPLSAALHVAREGITSGVRR